MDKRKIVRSVTTFLIAAVFVLPELAGSAYTNDR